LVQLETNRQAYRRVRPRNRTHRERRGLFMEWGRVGVGVMVAHDPLYGSGRAAFPHPALASGNDPKSPQGIRMTDAGRRQPTANEPLHPVPANTAGLATARQRVVPVPTHLKPKQVEGPIVR